MRRRMVWAEAFGQLSALREIKRFRQDLTGRRSSARIGASLTMDGHPSSENYKPTLSVLILAYYPSPREIGAVLKAMQAQTFPLESWELVIIDNGTKPPVAEQIDVSWHPHARCLREERPGTQFARLTGVRECRGEFILIVDQDNVLAPDYIEEALRTRAGVADAGSMGRADSSRIRDRPSHMAGAACASSRALRRGAAFLVELHP